MDKSYDNKSLSYRSSIKVSLEKEIDQVISQIEEEKRSETTLNEEIARLEQEIEKKRNRAKDKDKELSATCTRLEKQLEFAQVQFDLAQNESLSIRNKIDHMRIVLASWKTKVKSIEQDIQKFKSQMSVKNREHSREKGKEKDKLNDIHLAMSKTANERMRYTQKLEAISVMIKKDKQNTTQVRKNVNENIEKLMSKKVENNDVFKVTAELAKKSGMELKNYCSLFNRTKNNNNKLIETFESVKERSDIIDEKQFVETFVNSYEETSKLSKYLLETLAEIESLEYANKKIKSVLEENGLTAQNSQNNSLKVFKELEQNLKSNYSKIHKNLIHHSALTDQIKKVKKLLEKSVSLGSGILPEETLPEDATIQDYLWKLEEIIQCFNIFSAYERNESPVKISPPKSRNQTPDFLFKNPEIKEFLTSRDPFDDAEYDEDKIVMYPDIWRQRAQAWMENPSRTKTPLARLP